MNGQMVTRELIYWTFVIGPLVGLVSALLYQVVTMIACNNKEEDNMLKFNLLYCQVKNEHIRNSRKIPLGFTFFSSVSRSMAWENIKNKIKFKPRFIYKIFKNSGRNNNKKHEKGKRWD